MDGKVLLITAIAVCYCALFPVSAEQDVGGGKNVADSRHKDSSQSDRFKSEIYFMSDDEDSHTNVKSFRKSQVSTTVLDSKEPFDKVFGRARRETDESEDENEFEGSGDSSEANPDPPEEVIPTDLPEEVLPEEVKPTDLPAEILPEEMKPTNLPAVIAPEEVKPTDLPAEILPEEVKPTNLPAVIAPEEIKPTNLPAVILPEWNRPVNLPAVVPPEWNGPDAANPTPATESETATEYPEEDPYDDLPEFDDDKYAPTNVCGRPYYCRKGYRGPCHRNEVFVSGSSSRYRGSSRLSCSKVSSYWSNGCVPAGHNALMKPSSYSGYCTPRYSQRPCFGYPSSYRYCAKTHRCYPCPSSSSYRRRYGGRSHCGKGMVFTDLDGINGVCRCARPNTVMCKKTNRCYPVYSQGPCQTGQWLEPDSTGRGSVCRRCPCSNPKMADGRHIYWNDFGRPGCYKSYTRGPCRPGMYFVIKNHVTGEAKCVMASQRDKYPRADPSHYSQYSRGSLSRNSRRYRAASYPRGQRKYQRQSRNSYYDNK